MAVNLGIVCCLVFKRRISGIGPASVIECKERNVSNKLAQLSGKHLSVTPKDRHRFRFSNIKLEELNILDIIQKIFVFALQILL
jgi:hypothetical protein